MGHAHGSDPLLESGIPHFLARPLLDYSSPRGIFSYLGVVFLSTTGRPLLGEVDVAVFMEFFFLIPKQMGALMAGYQTIWLREFSMFFLNKTKSPGGYAGWLRALRYCVYSCFLFTPEYPKIGNMVVMFVVQQVENGCDPIVWLLERRCYHWTIYERTLLRNF